MYVQGNVIFGKCTFREMYVRDNVVSAKCFSGKCNFWKVFFGEVYRILVTDIPSSWFLRLRDFFRDSAVQKHGLHPHLPEILL